MNPYDSSIGILDESHSWGFDGSRTGHRLVRAQLTPLWPTQSRTEVIEARLRDLEAELADIKRFGEDTYEDGDVLTFKGDYNGPKTYAYAALKAGGKWHLTGGKAIQHASWDALVEFMRKANVRKVRRVTETDRVV